MDRLDVTMRDGVRYCVWTAGEGAPLLLLHGFTGSGRSWDEADGAYVRLIAPDLLGHGATDAPPDPARYRMDAAAADVAALLPDEPVHVLGYSMGGRLALYFALHYPSRVRSLVLESAAPGIEDESERAARRAADEALAAQIERDGVAAFIEKWERLPLFAAQTEGQRAAQRAIRLAQRAHGLANSLRGMGTGIQPSLWGELRRLHTPTLLISGGGDAKFTRITMQIAAAAPKAAYVIIDGAGHTPHIEQPEAFYAAVGSFLRRV